MMRTARWAKLQRTGELGVWPPADSSVRIASEAHSGMMTQIIKDRLFNTVGALNQEVAESAVAGRM
jgi:hypothetical protein